MEFRKPLRCLFTNSVICTFVKREGSTGVMTRCFKCSTYIRIMAEMEEEDDRVMAEIDEEYKRRDKELGR